tara:strand:+ start:279 stop:863 length:585 start_codon:yes stop_codon:yes gene_type:complete
MGTPKTVEKVQHNSTPKGLRGTLFVKWVEGRELLRNSKKFATIADWEPASTVGTRVVYDSEFEEYCVYVYINEKRYFPADHFETDKSEALAVAKSIRNCDSFGVKVKAKKSSPKGKKDPVDLLPKKKTSPKGKAKTKAKAKSSPKVTKKTAAKKTASPKVTKKATKSSPKVKPVAKKAVARRARKSKPTVATKK